MKHGKWDVKHGILQVSVTTITFRALGPDPGHESGAQHGLSRVTVLFTAEKPWEHVTESGTRSTLCQEFPCYRRETVGAWKNVARYLQHIA